MNISIIGAGNGGQAMAGHFTLLGHNIKLFNRSASNISSIIESREINLYEKINAKTKIKLVTDNLEEAVNGVELIMITTTADAHKEIARLIAPFINEGQTIILNPGRTLGAIEFSNELKKHSNKHVFIGEAQSLIYACRADSPGNVRIIGIKDKVLLAAYPKSDTEHILNIANSIYNCFVKAENVLETSLENIGAIFHPTVILFNAAAIERGNMFYFYKDITPAIAEFLLKVDNERLSIGRAFDIKLLSVFDWISYAYKDVTGNSLLEKMRNNPAYHNILAPKTLYNRLLLEDVPTGILPLSELAKLANVPTPLLNSITIISQSLLGLDFYSSGRTLKNLSINTLNIDEFKASL
ncbi:NAD/NADP-dependent octopine/nopaline dehydrogenase family protein [Bacteroidota bacterium]